MKKLLLLITGLISSLCIWADTTYTLKLDNGATQSTAGYFTVNSGGGYNNKYTGTYNGVTYSKGLKINSSSSITFATKGTATVLIVQSTASNGTNKFKFDGNVSATDGVANPNSGDTNVKVFTFTGVAAGTHTITNDTETGLLFVSVTEASATSPTVKTMPLSAAYALGTPSATPLTVEVNMVDEVNNHLHYQWYVNSENSTENGTAITGAETGSYTPDISAVGTLYYYCVIYEYDDNEVQVGNSTITNTVAIQVIAHVEEPTFVDINGTVELDCETDVAVIFYSLDNGTTWVRYEHPFTILDNDATVLAKAQVGGGTLTSEVVSHDVKAVKAVPGSSSLVLYYDTTTNFDLDANDAGDEEAALIGKPDTEYEDWIIQIVPGEEKKKISGGNAISGKTTIKGSNGRQMSIMMPAGYIANRITLYSYVNVAEPVSDKSYWKEVAGASYGNSSIAMASWTDTANPDVRVFALDNVEDEITLNNAGRQVCFYAVIDYTVAVGSVALNSEGFATLSSDKNVYVSGAQAYTCTVDADNMLIDAQPIESNTVPAYNGVLLYGKSNTTVTLNYQKTAEALGANDLKPTTVEYGEGLATLEGALVLSGSKFKTYTGNAFDPNKAYLPWSDSMGAKSLTIVGLDEEEATAVTTVTSEQKTDNVTKTVKNGQLVIETADGVFTLAGARIK